MEGRNHPTFFRFEVNRGYKVCFDPFAQLRTVESLDSLLRFSLSFQRKTPFLSFTGEPTVALRSTKRIADFRTEIVLTQYDKSLSMYLVSLSFSDTFASRRILGSIGAKLSRCCS